MAKSFDPGHPAQADLGPYMKPSFPEAWLKCKIYHVQVTVSTHAKYSC